MLRSLLFILVFVFALPLHAESNPDWTSTLTPFRIADNLYYVGSRDLASYLVTTPAGNILINANLDTSPAQIRASVEQLGFRWADTKILLNSQAHFDHVGGAAQILRETHARNLVMEGDDKVMATGGHADFAFGDDITTAFTPTRVDGVLHDGSAIALGDPKHGGAVLIAHKTAGHTRGCTTFTLRALPFDVFLGAHGGYFDLLPKLERLPKDGPVVFIDPAGYHALIADAQQNFEATLADQRASVRER